VADEELKEQAIVYFQQAHQLQMQGDLENALLYYTKSIDLFPTAEAYTFRGWAYSFEGRLSEAILECQKAIATDPAFGNPYNDIGAYLIQKGQLDEAIPWLNKALAAERYESYCFPHMNLARIWEKKGRWRDAIGEYKKAVEANPEHTPALQALRRLQAMMN